MTVLFKSEFAIPRKIQREAGIKVGQPVTLKVVGSTIQIAPVDDDEDDVYTPAQRRAINRGIAQSEKEIREGKGFGPFSTVEELMACLNSKTPPRKSKPRKR